jgi:hypothetical protein
MLSSRHRGKAATRHSVNTAKLHVTQEAWPP